MLGKDFAPTGRASWNVAMNPVFFCSGINNFYVYAFYRNPWHEGSRYDSLLTPWLGYSQLMIEQSFSLLVMVMLMLITLSDWSRSLQLISVLA